MESKMKKPSPLLSTVILIIQILAIVLVIWALWLWAQPVQDAGDGIALSIFASVVALPLYVIGLLLTLIFRRTRKHIILALIPVLIIGILSISNKIYYEMTHVSHFNPTEYQYLVGKNIWETTELFRKSAGWTGEVREYDKKWYTLPGMILWVDKNENIVKVESYE